MNPVKLKAVAKKEFIHIYRDFRSLYMAIIIPVILVILFGYVLKMDVNDIPMVVWDQQNSPETRELLDQFRGSKCFLILHNATNYAELQNMIDNGTCQVGIVIPPDFSKKLKNNKPVPVQILLEGTNPNKTNIIMSYIQSVTQKYSLNLTLTQLSSLGIKRELLPIDNRLRIWFNPELESKYYIIPGLISIVMIIVGTLLTALVVAREWERGTMETLLSIPVSPVEIIFGKIIPYFIIGIFDLFVIMILAKILFNIEIKGSYSLFLFSSSLYLYVALMLGMFISIATKAPLIANQLALITTFLPSFLLSGFVFPIENLPVILQYITLIIPARYFVHILTGLFLKGTDISYLWNDLLTLFIFGLVLTVLCIKKSEERIK